MAPFPLLKRPDSHSNPLTSLEVPQRVSPRAARQLKTAVSEPDSVSSLSQASRTPKERSPKVVERRSPRSPASSEKKRPHRISELESQILQLQGDLKKAKDELSFSEAWKKQAEQDAEESGKQISGLSTKLEEAQRQILRLSSEESRACGFERISHETEQSWQAELEVVKKQHLLNSSALASAVNEILRLKNELEMVANSEAAQKEQAESVRMELENLKGNMAETECLVENMKAELKDSRESESQARTLVNDTLTQLESTKATVEALLVDGIKATESYKLIASELVQVRGERALFIESHRNCFSWIDEWYGLTLQQVRELEHQNQASLWERTNNTISDKTLDEKELRYSAGKEDLYMERTQLQHPGLPTQVDARLVK